MRLRGRGDGPCGGAGGGLEDELLGLVTGESCLVGLVLLGDNFPPRGGGGGVRVGAAGLGATKCSLGSALETAAS